MELDRIELATFGGLNDPIGDELTHSVGTGEVPK